MSLRWAADDCVIKVRRAANLWRTQFQQSASHPLSPLRHPCRFHVRPALSHKVVCLTWKNVQNLKSLRLWLCRGSQGRPSSGLHTSACYLNTSTSRWSAGLSHTMSRFRGTLDSVSKAVSGTHTELLSKIARLKAKPKMVQASPETDPTPQSQTTTGSSAPVPPPVRTSTSISATIPPPTCASTVAPGPAPLSVPGPSPGVTPGTPALAALASQPTNTQPSVQEIRARRVQRAITAPTLPTAVPTAGIIQRGEPRVQLPAASETTAAASSQAVHLFHPSSFSVNLDETYNYLAHHINSYFGSKTKVGKKKVDYSGVGAGSGTDPLAALDKTTVTPAIVSPSSALSSPKKGLGHYLSYSGDTVQALVGSVGSYIAPLVPRFSRAGAEPKGPVVEGEQLKAEDAGARQRHGDGVGGADPKAAEERAKRLLLQRERIIARVSVDNRTRALVKALQRASDVRVYINRVEELSYHLLEFRDTRGVAVKEKVIPCLLRLRQAEDTSLQAAVREALALVGYTNPVKGWGIRVLSIDGGGTRGLIALQTLQKLEALTGKPIHQLFDYICGVSTGSILGFMLGVFQIPLKECEVLYRKLGSDVFKQNVIVGTVKMGWNHAFYDSEIWENILKEKMGCDLMVETSRNPQCPKVAAVSTVVNKGTPLKAYVFRNYNLQPGVRSHYLGGCEHKLWQAIRASSAAPGYFQEFALGNDLHQDGGLLINNPTALAVHECKCLWPSTPVQCVVSLGTGRVETAGQNNTTYTSLKTKLTNVISSATDTEEVHVMLDALLPPDTYFRFNPYMNEEIALDESRGEKLNLLQAEGLRYLDRNQEKLRKAAQILTREKGPAQRLADWAKVKADMYDGISKLRSRL